jgi:glutathione S-transferase
MRLYHVPATRSTRVLWALEEIGAPYDLTVMAREDRQTEEHRRRHPLGRVPALEDDEGFLHESAALCLHLADVHPTAGLNFGPGTHDRGLVYQWTVFAMTELESAIVEFRRHQEGDPAQAAAGAKRFETAVTSVEAALADREFLVGDRFTVADLVCGAVLVFARASGLTGGLPNVEAYVQRLEERPARQRATSIGT